MWKRVRRRPRWLDLLGLSHRRQDVEKWRRSGLSGIFLVALVVTLHLRSNIADTQQQSAYDTRGTYRRLLSSAASEGNNTAGFTFADCTFEKAHIPEAWAFSHCLCIGIIFIAVAIVCDDFFVPSLEVISDKLQLSEDVAGATFMAAGSSAPELFTSVAGVAQQTDVGVGTIVGSAVFNLLIIIALTAALAGQVLALDWRPLARDSFFYAMSIGCFIGFAWDGYVQHYEACILLTLYALYIVLMVFNPRLMDWMGTWRCICVKNTEVSPSQEDVERASSTEPDPQLNHSNPKLKDQANNAPTRRMSLTGGHARRISLISRERSHSEIERERTFHHKRGSIAGVLNPVQAKKSITPSDDPIEEEETDSKEEKDQKEESTVGEDEEREETIQLCPCLPCCPAVRTRPPNAETTREKGGCWAWTKLVIRWILWIPAFPFFCLFSWTIPDCSKDHNRKWYILSFMLSVLWIMVLSFAMVTLVERTGCIFGIDSYIMGLVVVAIGTSIPDALSSVLVARDGYGDMAVSNAIGSNVFDINLGLGLPFIIRIAIDAGAPIVLMDSEEWRDYFAGMMTITPHAKFGFILLVILALALVVFGAARFRTSKWMGIAFVAIYVMFLAYAFTQEIYCVRTLHIYC